MEWIQIPIDNVLLSEHTTKELMTLIKYQSLYCQLEKEPNKIQLRKLFKPKDILFIQNYTQMLNKMCENQIKRVTQKRNRNKVYYSKNSNLEKIQTSDSASVSQLSAPTDKIRLDKTKEDNISNILKTYVEDCFEEFWKHYPKKRAGSKDKALQSYKKVIKEKRCNEVKLLTVVKDYAKSEEVSKGFAKGCSAWLNDDRFNNEYSTPKNNYPDASDIIRKLGAK